MKKSLGDEVVISFVGRVFRCGVDSNAVVVPVRLVRSGVVLRGELYSVSLKRLPTVRSSRKKKVRS